MSLQKTHHTEQLKLDSINYRKKHANLTQLEYAKNLGIDTSTHARREPMPFSSNSPLEKPSQSIPPVTQTPLNFLRKSLGWLALRKGW